MKSKRNAKPCLKANAVKHHHLSRHTPNQKFLEKKLYLTYFGVYEEFSLSDKYKLCFNKNKIECFSIVFLD